MIWYEGLTAILPPKGASESSPLSRRGPGERGEAQTTEWH